ncbi:MAG: lysophospholipid acyltransferase family protein [Candidatus Kapaibacteriales bacterium]
MIKRIRFYFEFLFVVIIGWVSAILPSFLRTLFGKFLGIIILLLAPSRWKIALENISNSFPETSVKWHRRVAFKSFQNLGITFAELSSLGYISDKQIKKYVTFENVELVQKAYRKGQGVLLLSAHYGNWEFLAYAVSVFLNLSVLIIVKPQSNFLLDRIINKFRTRRGNSVVSMYESAFKVVRTLQKGGIVALLADQSATKDKDIYVDFFGRPTATFDSPAYFALRYNVPIIVGFAERRGSKYYVNLNEIKHDDLTFSPEGIRELTTRYIKMLEEQIRRCPELWVWQHRRWKHSQ